MSRMDIQHVLAVGAHPDDVEILCAGTLARYRKAGVRVTILTVMNGDKGSFEMTTAETARVRREECIAAASVIGAEWRGLGIPDGTLVWDETLHRAMIRALQEIEYADRFPFESHPALVHREAYTKEEIRELVAFAEERYVEITPLLQSLGHLDYLLQHKEYRHLAEGGKDGRQVCPGNPQSLRLFKELAGEMMDLHPRSTYFHVGGDETRELGACPRCAAEMARIGKGGVYLGHMSKICTWVKAQGKRPLVWDDMFQTHPATLDHLDRNISLMYWDYETVQEKNPVLIARGNTPCVVYDRLWARNKGSASDLEAAAMGSPFAAPVDMEHDLTQEYLSRFRPYLGKDFPKYVTAFPYLDFYRDRSFEVIGCSCVLGGKMGYIVPGFALAAQNTSAFAQRLAQNGGRGLVASWWTAEAIPLEVCWHGFLVLAEYAWHPRKFRTEDFDPRFGLEVLGTDAPGVAEALYLLDASPIPFARSYFCEEGVNLPLVDKIRQFEASDDIDGQLRNLSEQRDKAREALTRLSGHAKAPREHAAATAHLILAAKAIIHKVNQVFVFHEAETVLAGRSVPSENLVEELSLLKNELESVRDETAEVFGRTMKPSAVEEELQMRYGQEAHAIAAYLLALGKRPKAREGSRP